MHVSTSNTLKQLGLIPSQSYESFENSSWKMIDPSKLGNYLAIDTYGRVVMIPKTLPQVCGEQLRIFGEKMVRAIIRVISYFDQMLTRVLATFPLVGGETHSTKLRRRTRILSENLDRMDGFYYARENQYIIDNTHDNFILDLREEGLRMNDITISRNQANLNVDLQNRKYKFINFFNVRNPQKGEKFIFNPNRLSIIFAGSHQVNLPLYFKMVNDVFQRAGQA